MTAWELRRHLAADHHLDGWGATWDVLLQIHDDEHARGATHTHEETQQ